MILHTKSTIFFSSAGVLLLPLARAYTQYACLRAHRGVSRSRRLRASNACRLPSRHFFRVTTSLRFAFEGNDAVRESAMATMRRMAARRRCACGNESDGTLVTLMVCLLDGGGGGGGGED